MNPDIGRYTNLGLFSRFPFLLLASHQIVLPFPSLLQVGSDLFNNNNLLLHVVDDNAHQNKSIHESTDDPRSKMPRSHVL
jgi:hypothetical protein